MDGRLTTRRAAAARCALLLLLLGVPRGVTAQEGTYSTPHGRISASLDCSKCHTSEGWTPRKATLEFDHDTQTGFPLTGRHSEADCTGCHLRRQFDQPRASTAQCATCHVDVHQGALGSDCSACHDTDAFPAAETTEDAHGRSSFPLTGAHELISCESCHVDDRGGRFSPLDADCFSCHEADYRDAQFVDHAAQGFPTDCLECHSVIAWRQAPAFEHATEANGFDLLGAHAQTTCESCHQRPGNELLFAASGQDDCFACHQTDYERKHGGTGISTDCVGCHGPADWDDADFDHSQTGFELLGEHTSLDCESCHTQPGNQLINTPSGQDDCFACHRADYNEEHAGSGIPTTCADCHTTDDWEGADFDHSQTGFNLVGAHAGANCESCHVQPGNQLINTPGAQDDCVACHQADYNGEHSGSGTPTTCSDCHSSSTWENAVFDHAQTGFALVGAHTSAGCESCHSQPGNVLIFTPPTAQDDCVACHQPDYNQEHAGTNFPTTCLTCHDTNQWTGATWDHAQTGFDLVGAHLPLNCDQCHSQPGNVLIFTPPTAQDDCVACHQPDYNQEHSGTGFPTTCLTCHDTNQWTGATFDHDGPYFPIYSGKHRGKWADCQDCHTVPGNFQVFSCLTCHKHRQSEMDDKHKNEPGYVYQSAACLSCHPDGDD